MALREIFKSEEATGKSNLISKGLIALNISYRIPDLRILCQRFLSVIVIEHPGKELKNVSATLTFFLFTKIKKSSAGALQTNKLV